MKRSLRKLIVGVAGLAALLIAGLTASTLVVSNRYPTEQTSVLSFELPLDFTKVRRILMRTEATKQITILAGDNDYLEETWEKLTPELDLSNGFIPSLQLELRAKIKVRSLDDYVGRPIVMLNQVVNITSDEVVSDIILDKPTERLRQYHLITHYRRDDDPRKTRVELRLTQEILTTTPWFAHRIADNRVKASVERTLVHQESAIRRLIAENRDKTGILPFR